VLDTDYVKLRRLTSPSRKAGNRMSWTMVYANNASGARVAGDIKKLIKAVRNGQSVRVVIESKNVFLPLSDTYVYSFEGHHIHVRNGIVFATNTQDVSCNFIGDDMVFQDDSYYFMVIASTKGILDELRWNVGEHIQRGHSQSTWDMRWFVTS
jgi:hypothetical protein